MKVLNRKQRFLLKKYIKKYLKIIIGTILMSVAISQFLLPNYLSTGGFSGVATIGYYLFNIPMGVIIMALNIPFFIISYFRLGKRFIIDTIIGTASLSIFTTVFETMPAITDDRFLACVFGGVIMGVGMALVLTEKSSTGGTDLISNIIKTYKPEVKMSSVIVIMDVIIVALNVLFFKEIEIALYCAIAIYLMGKIMDVFFEGIDFIKVVYIISKNSEKISAKINTEIKRGVTGIHSKGMYREEEFTMLMCVASRNEVIRIINVVKRTDSQAFVIVSNAKDVIGKGFKRA